MIADFWYTAWMDAGKPELNALLVPPFEKKENEHFKVETKAWKKNELIAKQFLISKKEKPQQ